MSITALDAVDKGRVRLNDRVTLTRDDLTLFHQPIAAQILGGGYTTTLGDLMFKAITTSDNTANDKLMRSIGGAGSGARHDRGQASRLDPLLQWRAGAAEQDRRADLEPELFDRQCFLRSARRTAAAVRQAAFNRYVEDPYDGAAPSAIVNALARLKRGVLLSPESTRRLLYIMGNTHTGREPAEGRASARLDAQPQDRHRARCSARSRPATTTSASSPRLTASSYTVAVMIKLTSVPLPVRMTLMNNVVRAVIAQHDMSRAARPRRCRNTGSDYSVRRGGGPAERLHLHRLDVDELADAEAGAFAAVARVLDPAEGLRGSERTLSLTKLMPASSSSAAMRSPRARSRGQHARAEAELAGVGDADRLGLVGRLDDRRDRTEHLLVVRGLAGPHVGEHRRRIPGTRPIRDLAAEQQPSALARCSRST